MRNLLKILYNKVVRKLVPPNGDIIEKVLKKELSGCKRVLDLGCGIGSPLGLLKNDKSFNFYSVGVDIFEPVILENSIKENKIHSEYINMNILDIDFPDNSFDCVLLIDVIEHLEENDFLRLLPKLEKISKKIIIITPNGFLPQGIYYDNEYQIHKSGWDVKTMSKLGFKCYGLSGLKWLRGEAWKSKIKPERLGNYISDLTQIFVYRMPSLAYHLICIKK